LGFGVIYLKFDSCNNAAKTVFYSVCADSQKFIAKNKLSPEMLANKQAAANAALDKHSNILKTRIEHEPMVSVFAHEDNFTYYNEEVAAAGENEEESDCNNCIIL
jgi:hypothetical protein